MGRNNKEDRAEWEAGRITAAEAADMGVSVEEANRLREEGEREAGNPLAPGNG